MIDIHCHLLPYIDDGAESLDHALDMADIAVSSGVSAICVTPHTNLKGYFENYESDELEDAFQMFKRALKQERIPLTVYRGAEIFSTTEVMSVMKKGLLPTMNHTKHCLIEFDFGESPWYLEHTVSEFLENEFVPVLAHPERYDCIQDDPDILRDFLDKGALTQINKGSVLGSFGRACEMCADYLLDQRLVTCIASDAHAPYRRNTDMSEIKNYLRKEYSEEYMERLLYRNPARIIGIRD